MTAPVTIRFPRQTDLTADEVVARVTAPPPGGRLRTGDERILDFLDRLSRQWLSAEVGHRYPELAALGFFLRRAESERSLAPLREGRSRLHVPRGLVLHFAPSNVETIFVYSWALSALAGNANIVRLSSRSGALAEVILDSFHRAAADAHPAVAATQSVVGYEHDEEVTAALSAACDLRVMWGGDRAVREIRRHALKPSARDLPFPDRSSFTVLRADGWLAATARERQRAAENFFNDAFWFDQAACSSPGTVFWIGEQASTAQARRSFHHVLEEVVTAHAHTVSPAMAIEKRVAAYGLAAEGAVSGIRFAGNSLAFLDLVDPDALPRRWLGAGTFPETRLEALRDLAPLMTRHDQTMTHFGFTSAELGLLAEELSGYGVDRLVPLGGALRFTPTWDGYDLMREYTRVMTIDTSTTP